MKHFAQITLLTLIWMLSSISCSNNTRQESQNSNVALANRDQNLNVSIFLDLSDRISPISHPNETMPYYTRDIGYIKSIVEAYQAHMLSKKIVLMNDRIQVYIDPPPANTEINSIISDLRVLINQENVTKETILGLDSLYVSNSQKIYELAIQDSKFVGSDIWGFLKSKAADYCISDEHRNILIILTDGYAYHMDNAITHSNRTSYLTTMHIAINGLNNEHWKDLFEEQDFGFISENMDVSKLEILVLGINANNSNPYEEDVIKAFWTKWFQEIGVSNFAIKTADLPVNLDELISQFILKVE